MILMVQTYIYNLLDKTNLSGVAREEGEMRIWDIV